MLETGDDLGRRMDHVTVEYPGSMTFVGIDLAADPKNTGIAILREDSGCVVDHVRVGVEDDDIVEAIRNAGLAGVDVPLGWPKQFVELITAHAAGTVPAPVSTGPQWRRSHAMRATDAEVHRRTGLTPLSVSTDRIAHPALRWAGIEARLRELGVNVARDGSGVVCEVYPAAALHGWSLGHRGYKGRHNAEPRAELVAALALKAPWLAWNGHRDLCSADDNALDAVLAALICREVALGRGEPPPEALLAAARQEGWIWLTRQESPTAPAAARDQIQ